VPDKNYPFILNEANKAIERLCFFMSVYYQSKQKQIKAFVLYW